MKLAPAVLVLLVIALASCGGRAGPASGERDAASPPTTSVTASTSSDPGGAGRGVLTPVDPAALLARAREPGARATLVNVWATWCVPCREEFPELVRLTRDYRGRGLRVLLVSADLDSADARRFLADQGVDFETYLQIGDAMTFINRLDPKWTGALPATFVYDAGGRLTRFWEGRADYARFETAALAAMGGPAPEQAVETTLRATGSTNPQTEETHP